MRTIFHLDLDAFFVSVERILDPSLRNKPVIVGANPEYGRGVVAACSYEAREHGLHSGMPIKQAYRLCPNGEYISGSHGEYGRFSIAVKNILEKYAPQIEPASIDEFYMDFTGCTHIYGSLFMFASKLQAEIWKQLGLPCSIGIARNKTIAKIASDFMKPHGITYVLPEMEKAFLAPMPAESMPGIGKETIKALHDKGFYTLGDIAEVNEDYFSAAFGKYGTAMWRRANGEGSEYLSQRTNQKSISHERTFKQDEIDKKYLEEVLFNLTAKVCQSLRHKNWQASTIILKLRYADFITLTRSKTIKATSDDKTIFNTAVGMLRKAYTRRVAARLIGVSVTKFSPFSEQEILFRNEDSVRESMLKAVSFIRNRYGFDVIKVGSF